MLQGKCRLLAQALKEKFIVRLTAEQRDALERLAAPGQRPAATVVRARILLKAEAEGPGWTDDRIAEALATSTATVAPTRKPCVPQKSAWHDTPQHGSGRNGAAREGRVRARPCRDRRLPDREARRREVAAWVAHRNAAVGKVAGQFTPDDARVKLKRLYPTIELQ